MEPSGIGIPGGPFFELFYGNIMKKIADNQKGQWLCGFW